MQVFPDVRIEFGLPKAIPRKTNNGLVINDTMGNLVGSGVSDSQGILPATFNQINPTLAVSWASTPTNVAIDGAEFARFYEDGVFTLGSSLPRNAGQELSGFFITPRLAPLDSKIGPNGSTVTSGKTAFNWTSTVAGWVTIPSLDPNLGTALNYVGGTSYAPARTIGTLPANRGFACNVELGILGGQTSTPSFRLIFGEVWAIHLLEGKAPRIEYQKSKMQTTGSAATTSRQWNIIKNMQGLPPVRVRGGRYQIQVFRLAGRLCVVINGQGYWFMFPPDADNPKGREVSWDTAPLQIEPSGVRVVRFDASTIKWSAANGTRYTGMVTRQVVSASTLNPNANPPAALGGWPRAGTSMSSTATVGANSVTYTITLTANADGIDTPFLDKYSQRFSPAWITPSPSPLDVRCATDTVSVSLETGINRQGSEATVQLDRWVLDLAFPYWREYVKMDNPINIYIRRGGTSYSHVFSGYVSKPVISGDNEMARKVHVTCRDSLMRIQRVGEVFNAIVDHRCFPLDLLFAERYQAAHSSGGYNSDGTPKSPFDGLYFADAVKEIVRLFMGDDEAERINGTGNPRRFYPSDQPPIMSDGNDVGGYLQIAALTGQPVAAGGWILPPPFGQDPYSWIMDLAKPDRCVFFMGWPPGYTGQKPCVIYGRLPIILRETGLRLHILRDVSGSNPATNTQERLLKSVSVERRPERTFNRVVVEGDEEPGLAGIAPSLRIAEYNLASYEQNAAWRSWEKTLLVKEPIAYLAAEAIGAGILSQMEDVDLEWPTFTLEFDERIAPCHLVQAQITGSVPDVALGINNVPFRAENVEHTISFVASSGDCTTVVRARPLSAAETRGFGFVSGNGGVSSDDFGTIEV